MTSPINTAPQLFASPNQIPHSLIATKKYSSKLSISLSTSKSIQVPMQDITGFLRLTPDIKHEIKITEIMIQIDGFEGSKSNRQRFFNSPAKLQNNVQLDSTRTIPYTLEFQNNTLISSFYNQSIKIHDIFGGVTYCISALVNFTVDGTSYQTSTYLNVIVADILERKIETPVLMKATAPTRTLFNNLSGEISITAQPIIMEWESGSLGLVNVNIVNNSLKKVRKISVYLVERFKNNVSFSRRIVSKKSYGGWNCWFDGVDGNESKDLQVDVLVPVGAASIVGKMVQVSYAALVKVRFG